MKTPLKVIVGIGLIALSACFICIGFLYTAYCVSNMLLGGATC